MAVPLVPGIQFRNVLAILWLYCYRVAVPHETLITEGLAQTFTILSPTLHLLKMTWSISRNAVSNKFLKARQALAYCPNCVNEISLIFTADWSCTVIFSGKDWEKFDQIPVDRSFFQQLEKLSIQF